MRAQGTALDPAGCRVVDCRQQLGVPAHAGSPARATHDDGPSLRAGLAVAKTNAPAPCGPPGHGGHTAIRAGSEDERWPDLTHTIRFQSSPSDRELRPVPNPRAHTCLDWFGAGPNSSASRSMRIRRASSTQAPTSISSTARKSRVAFPKCARAPTSVGALIFCCRVGPPPVMYEGTSAHAGKSSRTPT